MIYQVNGYNGKPTFFVDQAIFDANPNYTGGTLIVGSQSDAQAKLDNLKKSILAYEAIRFSICATFVNGNDTTWREITDDDPEDTVCQVFNTFTGQYTAYPNKTEAIVANEMLKQQFIKDLGLDVLIEISELPILALGMAQPKSIGTQSL